MPDCNNQVGVRNIFITFKDCDSDTTYGPISHELAGEELPQYKFCDYRNEPLPGGYVRKLRTNNEMSLVIIRDLSVPLAMYQGCAAVDITVEHHNGTVVTGFTGTSVGDESSDGHEVTLTATFREMDEILPSGASPNAA
jgi:hypothetical protein